MKKYDWVGLLIYLLFNTVLLAFGVSVTDNPLMWLSLNGLLVWSDLHSYRNGLHQGGETVKQIWGIK